VFYGFWGIRFLKKGKQRGQEEKIIKAIKQSIQEKELYKSSPKNTSNPKYSL
jgi:hypothetical protein